MQKELSRILFQCRQRLSYFLKHLLPTKDGDNNTRFKYTQFPVHAQLENPQIKRDYIVEQYIKGSGIEIGALHNPLPIPQGAIVHYVDRLSVEDLRKQYPELAKLPLVHVHIIDNGETLETIANNSQDFVVANHFLEHCQNPLLAIENMFRVLKQGGILYMAIPDKRYTFDIERPVTSYRHLLQDYEDNGLASKKQHFEEWARLVDKKVDDGEIIRHVEKLLKIDYSIHFHVWTQIEMIDMFLNLRKKFDFDIEMICANFHEVIFVLRSNFTTLDN